MYVARQSNIITAKGLICGLNRLDSMTRLYV
jgi:hypothetical protein